MKKLILMAIGYTTKIVFEEDEMIELLEDRILDEAVKNANSWIITNERTKITMCFDSHNSMMEFAKYICNLCLV